MVFFRYYVSIWKFIQPLFLFCWKLFKQGALQEQNTSPPAVLFSNLPVPSCYAKQAPVISLIHSFIPSSCTVLLSIPPLHHSLTLPCTTISLCICLPAFLGHSAPPTFIHTAPCFVFMLPRWRWGEDGGGEEAWIEGWMEGWFCTCFNNKTRRRRSRR